VRATERLRWLLAAAGPLLLETASIMPFYGGGAKSRYHCQIDPTHCPNDYLPIMELLLPIVTVGLLYPFARLSFSLLAPDPVSREMRWRLATDAAKADVFPILQIGAAIGGLWTLWRATSYVGIPDGAPYLAFWLVFTCWFTVALAAAWPRRRA
jgi:hypothetical protein